MNNENYIASNLMKQFRHSIEKILHATLSKNKESIAIEPETVFQRAKKDNRNEIFKLAEMCLLEGSEIKGAHHWNEFYHNFTSGKSSIILAEHKSNLDVVLFYLLMKNHSKELEKAFEDIVFIAGRKLNEESLLVRLFAETFNRLVVVPKSETTELSETELEKAFQINYASQQFIKKNSNDFIYFIYPTATRSRPYMPETYQGITEVVNYLKKFDQVIFMSTDGNCMFPTPDSSMENEPVIQDRIVINFSPVHDVKSFIQKNKEVFDKKEHGYNNFKVFLTDVITNTIYNQKEVLPWEEKWVKLCMKTLSNTTKE